jgi:hypothetical protein
MDPLDGQTSTEIADSQMHRQMQPSAAAQLTEGMHA